ncbi:MAG: hypothetical protein H6745_20090 [Deltaproteobacteria bacterium]|nr:hypothetical protein [Deltaproteobacteria bacterium]
MTALIATFVASSCWLAACGDDGGNGTTTTDTVGGGSDSDTTGGSEGCEPAIPAKNNNTSVAPAAVAGNASTVTGVSSANVTGTEPPRAGACTGTPSYPATGAYTYPWRGLTVNEQSFTCNNCPDGVPALQGRWRALGHCSGATDAVDVDLPEPVGVRGAAFRRRQQLVREDHELGRHVRGARLVHVRGHGELLPARYFWVTTEVLQDTGNTGAHVGEIFKTDVSGNGGVVNNLFFYDSLAAGSGGIYQAYCKIGDEVGQEACYDPYTRL